MGYTEWIGEKIEERGYKKRYGDGYVELHHIIPKCIGGSDEVENLVYLSGKEHYEAHKMLAIENPDCDGLQTAGGNMCQRRGEDRMYVVSAEEYEDARKRHAEHMKKVKGIMVRCVETGKIYMTALDASREYSPESTTGSNISKCCRGKRERAYGYHGEYVNQVVDKGDMRE